MTRSASYYQGVRGSAALPTAPLDPAAVPAEALAPGEMRRLPFAGELLGAARVRGSFAAIPLDAFDRAAEALEAEEQAAWLQLLRLSYGEGRNWARAGKRELMARLRLSERRLLRVLDALVRKGFVRPLHRDNRGTLWRVALVREALGEPAGDDVLLGRAAPAPVDAPPPDGHARRPRVPSAGTTLDAKSPLPGPLLRPASARERELARRLVAARGQEGDEALAAALREVRELVEEGQSPARIEAAVEAVRRRTRRAAEASGAGGVGGTGGTEA